MQAVDRKALVKRYQSFKQLLEWSISTFKRRFGHWQVNLVAAGVPAQDEQDLAVDFLDRLDPRRYALFYTNMLNTANRVGGQALPATLIEAYDAARLHRVLQPRQEGVSTDTARIMVLADTLRPPPAVKRGRDADQGGRGGGRKRQTGGDTRDSRDDDQHQRPHNDDPVRGGQNKKNGTPAGREGQGGRGAGKRAAAAQKANNAEHIKCKICKLLGHYSYDCDQYDPNYSANRRRDRDDAYIIGECDDADSEAEADGNYVVDGQHLELAMFMDTEVLLDNQASQSVFRNAALLHDLTPIKSYTLGGIDKKSKGLTVAEAGGVFATSAELRAVSGMRPTRLPT
jgi:hypothetical protein